MTLTTEYQLIRSKRRTIAIEVQPDGGVIVRAPNRASLGKISVIATKEQWIQKHVSHMKAKQTINLDHLMQPMSDEQIYSKRFQTASTSMPGPMVLPTPNCGSQTPKRAGDPVHPKGTIAIHWRLVFCPHIRAGLCYCS